MSELPDERKAYEALNPYLDYTRDEDSWGREKYKHDCIQIGWEAWEARGNWQPPQPAPVERELPDESGIWEFNGELWRLCFGPGNELVSWTRWPTNINQLPTQGCFRPENIPRGHWRKARPAGDERLREALRKIEGGHFDTPEDDHEAALVASQKCARDALSGGGK